MTGHALLLPLLCKRCGHELEGGAQALVFLCRSCGLAVSMGQPDRQVPLVYVRARVEAGGTRVYAPFWRLSGKASWSGARSQQDRVYSSLRPLGDLFFPAFWSPRAAYHEDITLRYALDEAGLETEERTDPILDGVRPAASLGELARVTWLSYLDRFADVTGVSLEFTPAGLQYAAVPFFIQGDRIVEGVQGTSFPGVLFAT